MFTAVTRRCLRSSRAMNARSPILRLNVRKTLRPNRSVCRSVCMEEEVAATVMAAAIISSIGCLVDRRAGLAPIHRETFRHRRHATMAATAGASTPGRQATRNAGEILAGVFVSAIRGRKVVQAGGLEPPTSGSTDQRSNQLSYACTRDRLLGARSKRPEPRCRLAFWQAAHSTPFSPRKRKPGHLCPGLAPNKSDTR